MQILLERPTLAIVLVMLGIAAITDYRTGLIPNAVAAWGAGLGVLVQLLGAAYGDAPWGLTLLRMGLGFVLSSLVPLLLYAYGGLGGGDVKLFAAIGLCLGPVLGIHIQLWAHVLALVCVPYQLAKSGDAAQMLRNMRALLVRCVTPARGRAPLPAAQLTPLRFAPAIFAAAIWVGLLDARLP